MLEKENRTVFVFSHKEKTFLYSTHTGFFWKINYSVNSSEIFSLDELKEKEPIVYSNLEKKLDLLKKRAFIRDNAINTKTKKGTTISDIDFLVINPSNICNLNCPYCYSKHERAKIDDPLSINKVKKIVHFFANEKKRKELTNPLGITLFYTGEITLQFEYFKEIYDYIKKIEKKYPFPIFVFLPSSNFIEPTNSFIEFVNKYGFLTVSIDLRNKKAISKVIQNLTKIDKKVTTHVIIPIDPSINNLNELYSFYSNYFDLVSIRLIRSEKNSPLEWNEKNVGVFVNTLEKFIDYLLTLKEEELLLFLKRIGPTDYFLRYLNRIITREKIHFRCPAGRTALAISQKGEIYPCSSLIGKEHYLLSTWTNLKKNLTLENNFVKDIYQIPECRNCPIKFVCGGPCIDWKEKQTKESINPIECKINLELVKKLIYFIVSVTEKYPLFFDKYEKEKKVKNKINYSLDLDEFANFFQVK